MRHPRVVVYDWDGKLAWLLQSAESSAGFFRKNRPPTGGPGAERGYNWMLRQPRQRAACLRLLRGRPSILVVRIASKLDAAATADEQQRRERALHLLERVAWLRPETRIIAVSDVADDALLGLAWELGATHVLAPPLLPTVAAHLMQANSGRSGVVP